MPVGRDLLFYFYPLKAHLAEAARRAASCRGWTASDGAASPLLGAPSAAPFDPANVLFLVLPLGAAMKAWILLHLAVALAGFAAFARRLGLGRAGGRGGPRLRARGDDGVTRAVSADAVGAFDPSVVRGVRPRPRAPGDAHGGGGRSGGAPILLATAPEFVFYAAASRSRSSSRRRR